MPTETSDRPGAAPAPPPPPSAPPPASDPGEAPAPDPGPSRLGAPTSKPGEAPATWVSPSRCARPCAGDPGPDLVTVDDLGRPSAEGRHRVVASVQAPLEALIAAAGAAKQRMRVSSAFRDYARQAQVFAETAEVGRAARPGHSEHQLGTAVDLRLATSAVADWLAAHAHEFGFVLSYPLGKQRITGYPPEPWHVRHVGVEAATLAHAKGWSIEELFRSGALPAQWGDCSDCPDPASRPQPCGEITAHGRCDGDRLSFCFEGALVQIDCAAARHACEQRPDREPDCVPAPPPPQAPSPPPGAARRRP